MRGIRCQQLAVTTDMMKRFNVQMYNFETQQKTTESGETQDQIDLSVIETLSFVQID